MSKKLPTAFRGGRQNLKNKPKETNIPFSRFTKHLRRCVLGKQKLEQGEGQPGDWPRGCCWPWCGRAGLSKDTVFECRLARGDRVNDLGSWRKRALVEGEGAWPGGGVAGGPVWSM